MMRKKAAEGPSEEFPLAKPDSEWRQELTKAEYRMLRQAGTEAPGTGEYHHFLPKEGHFACRACKLPLYSSTSKFKECVASAAPLSLPSQFAQYMTFTLVYRQLRLGCVRKVLLQR